MAKPRTMRPGSDNKYGTYGANRKAWVETCQGTMVLYVAPPEEGQAEPGENVTLSINKPTGQRVSFDLSDLTYVEIEMLRGFLTQALDRAVPVTQVRDENCRIAWNNGEDSLRRMYRPDPRMVNREEEPPTLEGRTE